MHTSTTDASAVSGTARVLGLGALIALPLTSLFAPPSTFAQSDDPYYLWVQEYLSESFNIEANSATFVLGETALSVLERVNAYGQTTGEIVPTDPDDAQFVGWEEYYRYERTTAGDNQWGGGILFNNRTPWEEGDVGLALIFYRGDINGGPATIPIQYEIWEGDGVVWEAPVDASIGLTSDWQTLAIPFQLGQAVPSNHSQFAFWVGSHALTIDMPAPVLLNFGNRYTPEVLQALIDSGGQLQLTASFTSSTRRGVPPFEVTFDASNSAPADQIISYQWDFGDGAMGTGVSPTHVYNQEGRYRVTLTVRDVNNQTAVTTAEVVGFDGVGLPETPLEIPYSATAPTIDGVIDAVWGDASSVEIDFVVGGGDQHSGPADASATVRVLWDADNLYVLYEVRDDLLFNDSPESYQDDSVDLYLDGGNEKTTTYGDNDAQYEFSWYPPDSLGLERVTGNAVENGRAEGVDYTSIRTDDGYIIEAVVPWTNVDAVAVPGGRVGIEFMLNDSDLAGPIQSSKLSWFALQDNAWQRTDVFGTAVLVGGEDQVTAAQFQYSTPTGRYLMEVPVEFDGSSSYAPGGVASYAWDFGDGRTATGAMASHAFMDAGTYEVILTITGSTGETDSHSRHITVVDGTGFPEKPLLVPRAAGMIELDGEMEAAWESAQQVSIATRANNDPPVNAADLSATVHLLWDAEYLYVFYTVADDTLHNNSSNTWQDDATELYLDGHNDKTHEAYDENDAQFEFGWVPEAMQDTMDVLPVTGCTSCPDGEAVLAGAAYASRTTDIGYNIEARVAWSVLGVTPAEGHDFGIELMINDDDVIQDGDLDSRETKLQWFGVEGQDNPWQWAHVFGNARLVNVLPSDVEKADVELPDAFAIDGVYPNPFNPTTTAVLQVRQVGEYNVRIYNVLGQLVSRQALNVQQPGRVEVGLDFSRYASGMYLISIQHRESGVMATTRAVFLK